LSNPVTRTSALNTLNSTRALKGSQKLDGTASQKLEDDVKKQLENNGADNSLRSSSLAQYAYQGDIPKYQYKKSLSRKVSPNANYPDLQGNIQMIQTQFLPGGGAGNQQYMSPNYGYHQNVFMK